MTVRRLALLLSLLLAVTQMPSGVPAISAPPAHARPLRPAPMAAANLPPCCCRPGHCRMAMCHGNPDYARTHPGLLSCACGMAPRPTALLLDSGHRRGPLIGVSRCAPPVLRRLCRTYSLPHADTLRVRPAPPLEHPPRAC